MLTEAAMTRPSSHTRLLRHSSRLVRVGSVVLLTAVVIAHTSNTKGDVSDRAAEIFKRMHEQGAIGFETAIGGYVFRTFNYVPDEKLKVDAANFRKALEGAKEIRIKNERALGRKPDVAALDAEIKANIAEMSAKNLGNGLQTYAVKYSQTGDCYRKPENELRPLSLPYCRARQPLLE